MAEHVIRLYAGEVVSFPIGTHNITVEARSRTEEAPTKDTAIGSSTLISLLASVFKLELGEGLHHRIHDHASYLQAEYDRRKREDEEGISEEDLTAIMQALNIADDAPEMKFSEIVQRITVMAQTLTSVQQEHRTNSERLGRELDSERRAHQATQTQLDAANARVRELETMLSDVKHQRKLLERELSECLVIINEQRLPPQERVKEFHKLVGILVNDKPTVADLETRKLRVMLLLEEVIEFATASGLFIEAFKPNCAALAIEDIILHELPTQGPNLVEMADGLGDIAYVTYGACVSFGINMKPVFHEIQRSNMSKLPGGHRRGDGKWIKGPEYSPANIAAVLMSQGYAGAIGDTMQKMVDALAPSTDVVATASAAPLGEPTAVAVTDAIDQDVVIASVPLVSAAAKARCKNCGCPRNMHIDDSMCIATDEHGPCNCKEFVE